MIYDKNEDNQQSEVTQTDYEGLQAKDFLQGVISLAQVMMDPASEPLPEIIRVAYKIFNSKVAATPEDIAILLGATTAVASHSGITLVSLPQALHEEATKRLDFYEAMDGGAGPDGKTKSC